MTTTKTFILPSFLYRPLFLGDTFAELEEDEANGILVWFMHHSLGKCIEANFHSDRVVDNHDMMDIFLPCKCMQYVFEVDET